MARFFVDKNLLSCDTVVLTGENSAHAKVLRLKEGEQVVLCDGEGCEALCTVISFDSTSYTLKRNEVHMSVSEPSVQVSIYMSFPKADKLEHVIQKATELGAYEIVTFPSTRCISKPDQKSLQKKLERWQKIALHASEQSGRGRIPQVIVLDSYDEALERALKSDLSILFYENEHATTLHMALEGCSFSSISLLTGPEGGLEEHEVELARKKGFQVCTLGKRILRCETAPLCALSAVMYAAMEY